MTIGLGALLKALQTEYEGSALETAVGEGKLWPWGAPEKALLPYVTMVPGEVSVDYVMSASRMETIPVSFSVWLSPETFDTQNVLETTLTYCEALIATFDECTLDFSTDNWSLVRMGRTGYFIGPVEEKGWQIRVDYEVIIEEV